MRKFQIIPTRIHGILDYASALFLILAPYLFGFSTGGPEQLVAQATGLAIVAISLLTRYELAIWRVIPFPLHLGADLLVGVLLLPAPWLFGFSDMIVWPYILVGVLGFVVPLLSMRHPVYPGPESGTRSSSPL
jgi:hypothetical protein